MKTIVRVVLVAGLVIATGMGSMSPGKEDAAGTPPALTDEQKDALFKAIMGTDWPTTLKMIEASPGLACVADNLRRTPLHFAAEQGQQEAARKLVAAGAKTGAGDVVGSTALHFAAAAGQQEISAFLLEKDANVNAMNWKNETPLHCAAQAGHVGVVRLLLNNKAGIGA